MRFWRRPRPLGHKAADAPQTEDGERLAEQLAAHEIGAPPLALVHGRTCLGNVARSGKQERHSMLGGRDDVRVRRVAHDDAALGGGLDIDVVHRHARAPDDLQVLRGIQQRRVDHRVRMHDERIVGGDGADELLGRGIDKHVNFIAVLGERIDAFLHQVLGNQDLLRHERHLPHSSPSQGFRFITGRLTPPPFVWSLTVVLLELGMRQTSASTPALGMAL